MSRVPSESITQWRVPSLKRLRFLVELQRTGRWRLHYASEDVFNEALRAADADVERWKQLAQPDARSIEAAE